MCAMYIHTHSERAYLMYHKTRTVIVVMMARRKRHIYIHLYVCICIYTYTYVYILAEDPMAATPQGPPR